MKGFGAQKYSNGVGTGSLGRAGNHKSFAYGDSAFLTWETFEKHAALGKRIRSHPWTLERRFLVLQPDLQATHAKARFVTQGTKSPPHTPSPSGLETRRTKYQATMPRFVSEVSSKSTGCRIMKAMILECLGLSPGRCMRQQHDCCSPFRSSLIHAILRWRPRCTIMHLFPFWGMDNAFMEAQLCILCVGVTS